MPASASLLAASAVRIASLNLCADEYALLLARPGEIVSVTSLSRDPRESPLSPQARAIPFNRGTIEEVVRHRPTVVLSMGGSGRATAAIGRRLGIQVVTLPSPTSIAEVERNLLRVAITLGEPSRASPWIERIRKLQRSAPTRLRDTMFVSGGGVSVGSWSPAIEWMKLAGLRQRSLTAGKVTLEHLLTDPPAILLRSNYRSGEMSLGERWFEHPIVRRAPSRTIVTDGRAWTCAGPLMIGEIERLKARL